MHHAKTDRQGERGFMMLLAMVATLIPLFLIIGATTSTMMSRQNRLRFEMEDERVFAAAESGIDYALYAASCSIGLTDSATHTRDLGDGMSFTVVADFLKTDGFDNDADGLTDAADPSENMFKVVSTGTYRGKLRRLVAYLGPVPNVLPVYGALSIRATEQIQVQGFALMTGIDRNMNNTAGPGPNVPGISVEPPSTVATIKSYIDPADYGRITGSTAPNPSMALGPSAFDWDANRVSIQNTANITLNSESYTDWGKNAVTNPAGWGPAGSWKIIYRGGKVQFQGTTRAAGIMYVHGDLQIQGTFTFHGIIYCNGKVQIQNDAKIYGALVCDSSQQVQMQETAKLYYSTQAIAGASSVLPGKYVSFNGWQEIARQ